MLKLILIALGTLSLGIGIAGIAVPVLPTTPFLLLAAALYCRSSDRLYQKLLTSRVLGSYIRRFRETGTIPRRMKAYILIFMWAMITVSALVFLDSMVLRLVLAGIGIAGTVVVLFIPHHR